MKPQLDTDFVVLHDCTGRPRGWRRRLVDVLCAWLGHALWRPGTIVVGELAGGSLDVYATYCRRCFRGGYLRGDYVPVDRQPGKLIARITYDASQLRTDIRNAIRSLSQRTGDKAV